MKRQTKYPSKICYMLLTAVAVAAPSKPLLADDTDVFFTFNEENYTRAKPNIMFIMDENASMKAPGMFTYDEPLCGQTSDKDGNLVKTQACYDSSKDYSSNKTCYDSKKWYFLPNGNTKLVIKSREEGCGNAANLRTDRPLKPELGKYCSTLTQDIAKTGHSKQDWFLGLYQRRCKGWGSGYYDGSGDDKQACTLAHPTEEFGWWPLDTNRRAEGPYANRFIPHLHQGLSNTNKIHAIACMSDQGKKFKNKKYRYINTHISPSNQDNSWALLKNGWDDDPAELKPGNKKFVDADYGIIYSGNYLNYLATKTVTQEANRGQMFQAALKRYIERSNNVRLGLASFKPKSFNNTTCMNGGAGNSPADADDGYNGPAYCNGGGDGGSIDVPVIDIDEVHEKWRWLPDMIIPPEYPAGLAKTDVIAGGSLYYQNYSVMNADMPHRQWLWLQVDQYFGLGYSSGGSPEYPLRTCVEYISERNIPGLGQVNNFPLTMGSGSQGLATEYRPLGETLFEVGRYFKGEKPYFGVYSRPETWWPMRVWGGKLDLNMRPEIWSIEDYKRDVSSTVIHGPWGPVYEHPRWKDHWWGVTDKTDLYSPNIRHYESPIVGARSKTSDKIQDPCEANVAVIFTDYSGETIGNQWSDIDNIKFEGSPREDNQKKFAKNGALPPFDDNDEGDLMQSLWPEQLCDTQQEEASCGLGLTSENACIPTIGLKCKDFIDEYGTCLPGVAQYLAENDLSAQIPGKQNLRTFVVHYWNGNAFKGREPVGTAMLKKTAELGKGKYIRFGESLAELDEAIGEIMNITALNPIGAGTFVAPAASVDFSNRLQNSENVYFSLFEPSDTNRWKGNVKRYKMAYIKGKNQPAVVNATCNVNGEEVGGTGECAPALDVCNAFKSSAHSGWGTPVDPSWYNPETGKSEQTPDGSDVGKAGVAGQLTVNRNIFTDYCPGYSRPMVGNNELLHKADTSCFNIANAPSTEVRDFALNVLGMNLNSSQESSDEMLRLFVNRKVAYIQGYKGENDNSPTSAEEVRYSIGDPLHSQPKIVNYSNGDTHSNKPPKSVIYFGTNEGYLHAIDTDTGKEIFGFIPKAAYKAASKYHDNDATASRQKQYGIDGEIETWVNDTNGNGLVDAGEKAYIFFGMRRGGNHYYALDVTDPTMPKLAWEISQSERVNNDVNGNSFYDLGQTWAKPTLIKAKPKLSKVLDERGKFNSKLSSTKQETRSILVVTGGYDQTQDNMTDLEAPDSLGRAIYLVDAATGTRLWAAGGKNIDSNAYNATHAAMKYGFAANPAVFDVDGDSYIDTIIAADTGGQIWRINLEPKKEIFKINASGKSEFAGYETIEPKLELIAKLSSNDSDGDNRPRSNNRRFFNTADIMFDRTDRSLVVAIGSGRRTDPLSKEVANRMYVLRVKVNETYEENPPRNQKGEVEDGYHKTLTEADLFDATEKGSFAEAGKDKNSNKLRGKYFENGFLVKLGKTYLKGATEESCKSQDNQVPKSHCKNIGEKLMSNASIFNNTIIFTSYLPSKIPEFCGAALGDNRFNAISLLDPDVRVEVPLAQHGIAPKPAVLLLPAKDGERKPAIVVGTEVIKPNDLGKVEGLTNLYTLSRDKLIKMWLER